MPDLKEILGEAFTPEVEKFISETFLPKANVEGETKRLRDELGKTKKELDTVKTANMTAEEQRQAEIKTVLENAASEKEMYLKERAKIELSKGIVGTGINVSDYEDMFGEIAGTDPEKAKDIAKKLSKLITDVHAAGLKAANEQHIKNAKPPESGKTDDNEDLFLSGLLGK